MRTRFAPIGIVLSSMLLAALWLTTPPHVSAASVSEGDVPDQAVNDLRVSPGFRLEDSVTWRETHLTGTSNSFAIVESLHPGAGTSSAGAASSAVTNDTSPHGGTRGHGTYSSRQSSAARSSIRPTRPVRSPRPARQSSSASSQAVHPAAPETPSAQTQLAHPLARTHSLWTGSASVLRTILAPGKVLVCAQAVPASCSGPAPYDWLLCIVLFLVWNLLLAVALLCAVRKDGAKKPAKKKNRKKLPLLRRILTYELRISLTRFIAALLAAVIALGGSLLFVSQVHAVTTVPLKFVYNGHLLDSAGNPITTPHSIRFSFWKGPDYVGTDTTATGAINIGSANYGDWQEVQTITPNADGYFTVVMGSVTAMPSFSTMPQSTLLNLRLQVDVKASAAADTAYELLDPNASDTAVDRSQLQSVPFAKNADLLDQRDTGTGSGSIPVLQNGGLLGRAQIPLGLNGDSFTIDSDDTATTSIGLTFGQTLNKTLSYDISADRFNFNDSVHIQGDLTVTGLINGVDVTSLTSAQDSHLRASSGAGLTVNIAGGNFRINGDTTNYGGLAGLSVPDNATSYVFFTSTGAQVSLQSFPENISFIPVAQVTTVAGTVTSVLDRRVLQSDDRQSTILRVLHPGYEGASVQGDGSDNVGQLGIDLDNISLKNYYFWTSSKAALNDYDVIVRLTLPLAFNHWRDSLRFHYRSTSANAADNKLDIQVYDTNGNPVTLSGSTTNLVSTSWASTHVEFSGTPTWTPGQDILIRMRMSARNGYQMHLGDLQLDYVELKNE